MSNHSSKVTAFQQNVSLLELATLVILNLVLYIRSFRPKDIVKVLVVLKNLINQNLALVIEVQMTVVNIVLIQYFQIIPKEHIIA